MCSPTFNPQDVLAAFLFRSYICGGHDNHAITLSPPSVQFWGVKPGCNTHESDVTVGYVVRKAK